MSEASTAPEPIAEDGAHLDGFRMPEIDAGGDDLEAPQEVGPEGEVIGADPELMDHETFWQMFQLAFSLPGTFLPEFEPLGIQPHEVQPGRAASDACRDLLAIWYPQALKPGNETLGLILTAAPFLIAKVTVVRMILRNRAERARDVTPPEAQSGRQSGEATFRSRRAPDGQDGPPTPAQDGTGPLMPFDGVPG